MKKHATQNMKFQFINILLKNMYSNNVTLMCIVITQNNRKTELPREDYIMRDNDAEA